MEHNIISSPRYIYGGEIILGNMKIHHDVLYFLKTKWHNLLESFVEDNGLLILHVQSHGCWWSVQVALQWRHNEPNGISTNRCIDCLLNRLFMHRSKKISKPCITGLCEGNSLVTGEFPALRAHNAENVPLDDNMDMVTFQLCKNCFYFYYCHNRLVIYQ